jgi:hypothetical protein
MTVVSIDTKSQYSAEELGRIAALVIANAKGGEQKECARVCERLAKFSGIIGEYWATTKYSEAVIAWEAALAFGTHGEWGVDVVWETKQRIKDMVEIAEHLASNGSDHCEYLYWLAAVLMAAILE